MQVAAHQPVALQGNESADGSGLAKNFIEVWADLHRGQRLLFHRQSTLLAVGGAGISGEVVHLDGSVDGSREQTGGE